jgi:hypothetical protein
VSVYVIFDEFGVENRKIELVELFPCASKMELERKEGECIKNPNFMWTSCHSSCLEIAKNVEDHCTEWAEEGECSNNPNFILV